MKYDVIVIGAGSAGGTIAARLSESPGCSILLLEAGPDYPDLEQLPDDLRDLADELCIAQEEAISRLDCSAAEKQYYVALGYIVPVRITCPLPSAVYIAELRSGTSVHPTARWVAQQMGQAIKVLVPGIAMHHDMSEGVWDIKRGTQDIVEKNG